MSERFGFRSALRTLDADSRFGNLVSFRSPQIPFLKGAVFAALFADPKSAKTRNRRLLIHVPFDTKRYRFKKPVLWAMVSVKGFRAGSARHVVSAALCFSRKKNLRNSERPEREAVKA